MTAVMKEDRVLAAIWQESEGSSLPLDIKDIALMAVATSENTGNEIGRASCRERV